MDANKTPDRNVLPLEYQASYRLFEQALGDNPRLLKQRALGVFQELLVTQALLRECRRVMAVMEQEAAILQLRNRQMMSELCERNGQLADLAAELGEATDGTHF